MSDPDRLERHRRAYGEAIAEARSEGSAAFQSWFDTAATPEAAVVRGFWDFAVHLLTPSVCAHLNEPESLTALEIGYGGGRLLNAACTYFGNAVGVDVHGERTAVEAFLREEGRTNFRLLETDGASLPVPDESVDLVYSFIVLQHLPSYDVFERYLHEAARCLRPGGVAQLYYGDPAALGRRARLRAFRQGYLERPEAPVNDVSLVVAPRRAKRVARAAALRVVGKGVSYRRAPDGYPHASGGQRYLTLVKPSTSR